MSGDIVGHTDTVFTCNCTIPDTVFGFNRTKIGFQSFLSLFLQSFDRPLQYVCFLSHFHDQNHIFGFGAKFKFHRKYNHSGPISPDKGQIEKSEMWMLKIGQICTRCKKLFGSSVSDGAAIDSLKKNYSKKKLP